MNHGELNTVANRLSTFPVAEGLGIFFGIVAWDILAEGRPEILKALLIATPCALILFAIRCWKDRQNRDQ